MLKRPVILQVIPELATGGAERTVIEVAEAIVLGGGTALVASEGGRLENELKAVGGELIHLPAKTKNPVKILLNARLLQGIINDRGVDLLHARSRAPGWSAYLAAKKTHLPFVTTYHGVYNQKSALKSWYNSVMARGDVVIANSNYTAHIVLERHQPPEDRVRVIHRGVDLARFSPDAVSEARLAALRARWGVSEQSRLVVQASRLTRWKGQHVLIGAAALLARNPEFDDVIFVLAGDDQGRAAYREELESRIQESGLSHRVRLTGHCEDVPAAFLAASLGIVPSIEPEAFGRASIEAQAMGCPVIVSDIGALAETLIARHQENGSAERSNSGWISPVGDEKALADTIANALRLSAHDMSIVKINAREKVAAQFSKAALQARTLSVYDSLLGCSLAEAFVQANNTKDFRPIQETIPP